MRIVISTDIPSPYQVELFDALSQLDGWKVSIIYTRRSAKERAWQSISISHEHCFLDGTRGSRIAHEILGCDLAVFCGYRPAKVAELIKQRNRAGKPWVFWGERPGFHFPGWLGRRYRCWALREVRSSGVPVWAIGEWAIDRYRGELGGEHCFFNVPYFSDLAPFLAIERQFEPKARCSFLFCGSFIRRKGVDLLIAAFNRLIANGIDAELHLLGAGPLERVFKGKYRLLRNNIRVHGFKQRAELASVYAHADVLCAPSRYDGWGLAVVEGLAAGMPVISTDRTGAARELIDQGNGWVVPAGDQEALYLAMRSAANLGANRRSSMSEHARKTGKSQDIKIGVRLFARAAEMAVDRWRSKNSVAESPSQSAEASLSRISSM
jgi:glycosyltransferase involved in cell wall biosynthesis